MDAAVGEAEHLYTWEGVMSPRNTLNSGELVSDDASADEAGDLSMAWKTRSGDESGAADACPDKNAGLPG